MPEPAVSFNAVIVAGGRSSRLGGEAKAHLSNGRQTLLELSLAALDAARLTVVVGPEDLENLLPPGVLRTREKPAFAGPAAACYAGMALLAQQKPQALGQWTLLLAVDMPRVTLAVQALLARASQAEQAELGFMGHSQAGPEPLAGIYRSALLLDPAFMAQVPRAGRDLSVKKLLAPLKPTPLLLPAGSTDDVDTWDQAQALGFGQAAQVGKDNPA